MVDLGGYEIDRGRLQGPVGAETLRTGAAAALRRTIAKPRGIEPLPTSGWRLLDHGDDHAVFGAWDDQWDGWVVVEVARKGRRWRFVGSAYGVRPGPTRAERGLGLRLVWPVETFVTRFGQRPQLTILLRNERAERWTTGRVEYWPIASLVDSGTGAPLPRIHWVGWVPRAYELAPGESVPLPVALAVADPARLPPGRYELRAELFDLDLRSDIAFLDVTQ